MTDEQRAKFEKLGPYAVFRGVIHLTLVKRFSALRNIDVPVDNIPMNYFDVFPAIEYLQTALTHEESIDLLYAVTQAQYDLVQNKNK